MASSEGCLTYVLDLLSGVSDVTTRKIMDEYLPYASGKLFGGVYDNRFLVKDIGGRVALSVSEVPYEGASPTLLVDMENVEVVAAMALAMLPELPESERRRR